ncbi:MAG TPA: PQQ-dependent sugar dehydrogenase [Natronosporangium sp.]|nr:PQQ-dependent sugar dehydrogenase [Natronosporangium sp.]
MWSRPGRGRSAAAVIVLALIAGCQFGEPEQPDDSPPRLPEPTPTAPQGQPPEVTGAHDVLVTGLDIPWDLAFLPDGSALVTERATARILRVDPASRAGGHEVEVVQTIEGVDPTGEGGLLGIAVSPDYETDGWVFAYHSTEWDNRIVRFRLGEEPEPILTGIPHAAIHNGGRLAFGPDDYLYATTGDADAPARAQDPDELGGKILRMTVDGEPAPGNPFDTHVWAYGLRNPQGLAWDAADRLWATEFGPDQRDEINLIERGGNYGWPTCVGPCDPGEEDLTDPVLTWNPIEASCSGAAIVGRTLVAACLRGQRLWLVDLTDGGTVLGAPRPLLMEEYGRLRAAEVAPDGSLWLTTSNRDGRLPGGPREGDDRIIRLVVSGAGGVGMA